MIAEYIALTKLEKYLVGSNQLMGPLLGATENWTKLKGFSLGLNKIYGPIPPEIGSLADLGKNENDFVHADPCVNCNSPTHILPPILHL